MQTNHRKTKKETLLRHFFISNIMLSYLNIPEDVEEGKGALFDKCFLEKASQKFYCRH